MERLTCPQCNHSSSLDEFIDFDSYDEDGNDNFTCPECGANGDDSAFDVS